MALVDKAVADCLAHERLTNILGKPIKAFGELIVKMLTLQWSSCILRAGLKGGSRFSIPAKQNIDSEGRKGVRIHFYLQGVRKQLGELLIQEYPVKLFVSQSKRGGTVFLDAKEDSEGKMQTCHLVVQVLFICRS